ncbi:DUF4221 family protein [Belliella kenyensis]|uniref:DUF4221 family protein n=1 Tax=Belliella kenyensis TaxID=1472724 RepID=A0ABV8EJN5_9BACT|nr:DUF4221 family protein [Belliella kenyensis]MCH7401281.1 DUF4221 domain-containing protein [Belliella kenyensis]
MEEIIKIELDSITNPINYRVQLIETDSGNLLATMARTPFGINFYNLDLKTKIHHLELSADGINKVGVTNGFHVQSKDSIFITSIAAQISLLDFAGNKLRDVRIDGSSQYIQSISSKNYRPLVIENQKIYGAYPFVTQHWETPPKDISKFQHLFEYDLNSSKIRWLDYALPEGFWDQGIFSPEFSLVSKGDSIITLFSRDLKLNVFSKSKNKIIDVKELKIPGDISFARFKRRPAGNEGILKELGTEVIKGFIFDKYRERFIVILELRIDPEQHSMSLLELYSSRPDFKLVVLDSNFEYVGEALFKNYEADQNEIFVGKEGLYVSVNNQNHYNFDENFLVYKRIDFEEVGK